MAPLSWRKLISQLESNLNKSRPGGMLDFCNAALSCDNRRANAPENDCLASDIFHQMKGKSHPLLSQPCHALRFPSRLGSHRQSTMKNMSGNVTPTRSKTFQPGFFINNITKGTKSISISISSK